MALTTIKLTNSTTANSNVGNLTYTGGLFNSSVPVVLNDISTQFDGSKTVFSLLLDQTSINTITDSKDVQVILNGQILAPYVQDLKYPWITPYDSYKGYRIVSGNIIIYNAPNYGDQCVMIVRSTSQSVQTRRYPYTAATIAFGD
jgi:hypothetical protein